MNRTHKLLSALTIVSTLVCSRPAGASESAKAFRAEISAGPKATLWQDRGSIASLNLFYGPGGKAHQPSGKFTFVKEDSQGSSAKFEIKDQQGVLWKAKLGEETKSETAATRLLWAAGYFTDEDYYLPELRVEGMPKLRRGARLVSAGGVIHGARLERHVSGQKKSGNWSWFKNPFVGTKELNGLKIMMALVNNWDLKEINNAIYSEEGAGARYTVSDLGASFGRTGNFFTRSKSSLKDYSRSHFIQKVKPEHVDFVMKSRPFFLTVFDVSNYATRTRMQGIVKHIPRTDAKWLGQLLGQLSAEQIGDCFRAAGYSAAEVDGYSKVVRERIVELNQL